MAEVAKYQLIPNTTIFSDIKAPFSLFKTRKSSTTVLVYGVVLVFIALTAFVAFTPNSYSSSSSNSSWFLGFFTVNSTLPPTTYSLSDNYNQFDRSNNLSSISPTSRSPDISTSQVPTLQNLTKTELPSDKSESESLSQTPQANNLTKTLIPPDVEENIEQNGQKQSNQSIVVPQIPEENPTRSQNITAFQAPLSNTSLPSSTNLTETQAPEDKGESLKQSNGEEQSKQSDVAAPQIPQAPENSASGLGNSTNKGSGNGEEEVKEKAGSGSSDFAASLSKKQSNEGNVSGSGDNGKKQGNGKEDLVGSLVGCELYDGEWVRDESYPLYKPGSCSFIDPQFNCIRNGRPDKDFQKLKWKPKGCTLPRLTGDHMLKLLKGKRLVFVGDSLNRNMWESLVCLLMNSAKDRKKVYEAHGRHSFRTDASYIYVFKDYNFTVEFFVAPFLVQQFDFKEETGKVKETLRLDLMMRDAHQFKNADFLVFNTGHWWTHEKTSKGDDYYQEGSHVYKQLDVNEAFRRAITTWGRWIDANIDPQKTHVFFRGYSPSHFSGGQWNSGGGCDNETEPIRDDKYLTKYPLKMKIFENVTMGMKTPISVINITRMADYRKDAHPSIYRREKVPEAERREPLRYQDCSHWCLPGVPDSWNELLYAELLRKQYKDQLEKNKT